MPKFFPDIPSRLLVVHAFPREPRGFKSQMPWIHRPKANQCAPLHPSAKLFNWPTVCAVQLRGGGGRALKKRFGRGVSPRPSNPDAVFKTAHD